MSKLTDKQRKKIIADRVDGMSLNQLAKKYKVSVTTIHRTLENDPETEKKVKHKKAENTQDILSYMDSKREIVCEIIGNGLEALCDPDKLKYASPVQITTALGTLIDKWTAVNCNNGMKAQKQDALSESLKEFAKGLESDD